jgi:excisionase family DNA binding protein
MDRKLLRPREVAFLLGLGRTKVYELMDTGELPSVRIGTARRIPVHAVEAYLGSLGADVPEAFDEAA